MRRALNNWLFLKNGYSALRHAVPFAIAALLLLTLSLPADDLLPGLVVRLQDSAEAQFPALLLSLVALAIYVATMRAEARRAYLTEFHVLRRTIFTTALYIGVCGGTAYAVLRLAGSVTASLEFILWACFLVAILSLNGVGWPISRAWVETVGVSNPDYHRAHRAVERLWETVRRTATKSCAEPADVAAAKDAVTEIAMDIDNNIALEPEWAREELRTIRGILRDLGSNLAAEFPENQTTMVENFSLTCDLGRDDPRSESRSRLKTLTAHFPFERPAPRNDGGTRYWSAKDRHRNWWPWPIHRDEVNSYATGAPFRAEPLSAQSWKAFTTEPSKH